MPCPTCEHTMQKLGDYFWCPRCGTVQASFGYPEPEAPALVQRCRDFAKAREATLCIEGDWTRLGISESINTPENR